jgi:N-acetylmuramic acid 6-phosphate etherase
MIGRDLMSELGELVSESRNPRTTDIDVLPTVDVLRRINDEDKGVAFAVEKVIPEIAAAVERIVAAFHVGGRLIYIGAGTSGRIGVLDASECPPTFSVPEGMVVGLVAGGNQALAHSFERAEDDPAGGRDALEGIGLTHDDVVVGIAASGRTPYVIGALAYARDIGATTVALACNPDAAIAEFAEIAILPVVGPEALTGSTRMKAGTAQKLVLNMLSTASMIRIGKSFENLMVDVQASNEKLDARAVRIVMAATACSREAASAALERTGKDVKLAILTLATGLSPAAARKALTEAHGFLREAIEKSRAPVLSAVR